MAKCISTYKCAACPNNPAYKLDEMREHLDRTHGVKIGSVKCDVTLANLVIQNDGHYTNTYRMRFETGELVMKTEDIYLKKEDRERWF